MFSYKIADKEYSVPLIGTWSWGGGFNGSRLIFGQSFTEDSLKDTFNKAYDAGFVCWDTAEVYGMGRSEQILGRLIKDKNVMISTKHFPVGKYKSGECRRAIENSLERLGIQSIDLYWLHSPVNIKENMRELADCYKDGLIKSIGLSNGNTEEINLASKVLEENGSHLTAIQNHYSLLSFEREQKVLELCREKQIIFFGYMLLEQGALSGHYDKEHTFERFSARGLAFGKGKFEKIDKLIGYERKLAEKYNVDSSQIPIAWGISKGVVPIVGINKPRHTDSLVQGVELSLTSDETATLERLALESGVKCKGVWEKH